MAEPIRVLRVIARLNVGGPALHVSYLTKGLDDRGYETTLVTGAVGPDEGSMEYVAAELGIEPVFLPELRRDVSPVDARAVASLRRLIRELRPDVLHTHTAKAGAVGRLAARAAGAARPPAVVHTFHGHVLRGYFGPAQTRVFLEVERSLARTSDALVAVSEEVRDELVRLRVAPADRFDVIRLGLDLGRRTAAPPGGREEERTRLGVADDAFLVGWFGRMTEIKRVDDLLRAFALLRAREPASTLLLVGDGPLRSELERLADSLGIADSTRFVGMRRDVGALLAATDAVALTSANEGTPVTLIEALAASRPVVSTDVGGVRDVVREGESGLLAPSGDVDAIAAELASLAADPGLRERLGRAGRDDVVERYSIPRLLDDVDSLYRRLLSAKGVDLGNPGILEPGTLPPALRRPPATRSPRCLRVLLLSQYFPPEVGATQSRMQAFAEYLAARGHDVTVIAEFPNHPQGVLPAAYRGRLLDDDRSNPYRVIRVWVKASLEKTPRTRMSFYLSYMALATLVAPLAGRVDVVVASSPPLFAAAAGLTIARLQRVPFLLDIRDLWPAAAVSLDQLPSGPTRGAAEWLERLLYREASAVAAVTHPFCAHVDAIRRRAPATTLLPNGTLEAFLEAEPSNGARERLGATDGAFVVTYAGNFGIAQALPAVVEAAAQADDGIRFVLIGEGPLRARVARHAVELGARNVSLLPQLPLHEVPPLLAASDALIVPLSAHPTFAAFMPSKLLDSMATGRPVLLSAAGESRRVLERVGAGLAVEPEDPAALAAAAAWLRAHPREARAMGERGRAFAGTRLRAAQAARLEALLLDLVDRSGRRPAVCSPAGLGGALGQRPRGVRP